MVDLGALGHRQLAHDPLELGEDRRERRRCVVSFAATDAGAGMRLRAGGDRVREALARRGHAGEPRPLRRAEGSTATSASSAADATRRSSSRIFAVRSARSGTTAESWTSASRTSFRSGVAPCLRELRERRGGVASVLAARAAR